MFQLNKGSLPQPLRNRIHPNTPTQHQKLILTLKTDEPIKQKSG